MMYKRQFCLIAILVLWFLSGGVFSQSYLQFQASQGYTVAHNSDVREVQGYPFLFKLDYASRLKGKEYHDHLKHPLAGMSLTYINHDNRDTGRSYSISGFLQPTLGRWGSNELSTRISLGLAYVTNPFDPINNQLQKAIGSNVNYLGEAQLIYSFDLSDKFDLNFQTGITHISNAARKLPNSGLNILFFGAGLSYQLSEESSEIYKRFNHKNLAYEIGRFTHTFMLRSGVKSIRALDFAVFPAYGANYTTALRYSPIGSWTAGLDLDYNRGYVRENMAVNESSGEERDFVRWRTGFAMGHEFHMNKLSFLTQFATYLKRPRADHNLFYQRYGLKYHLTKNWLAAATLRAHGGRADYMEWTLGYSF
ncbi:Lipid A 3-O-deacylase (PagL) [Belliella pelovolcani]|uniref:Lipid A 3-O-deacylase (PagL) n=1 Tax=Belliella pelovolcani TaxID=529505 RepID=A0A1N7NJL7_9BACT|nr:Lipid A 3-O-deacylase (PagL) [Belliella pelovolcani]